MGVMRTLTINGQKYTVDDPNAIQIPDTAPEKGTVPTSDGEGGTEWEKPSGSEIPSDGTEGQVLTKTADGFGWEDVPVTEDEIVTVTVTGSESTSWKSDKTITELIAAHNAGKTLRCLLNGDYAASLVWFDNDASIPAMWFVGPVHLGNVAIIVIGTSASVTVTPVSNFVLPGGTDGQFLTLTDGSPAWADLPEAEAELPTGGSNGQVLTLVSGSPAWADPSGGGGAISHFIIKTVQKTVTGAYSQYTIDRTMEEVLAAYNAGYSLELRVSGFEGVIVPISLPFLTAVTGTSNTFYFGADLGYYTETGSGFQAHIFEYDGVAYVNVQYKTFTAVPTGGTAGQVLTVLDDGSVGWADPTGGSSVASAEGVAF